MTTTMVPTKTKSTKPTFNTTSTLLNPNRSDLSAIAFAGLTVGATFCVGSG